MFYSILHLLLGFYYRVQLFSLLAEGSFLIFRLELIHLFWLIFSIFNSLESLSLFKLLLVLFSSSFLLFWFSREDKFSSFFSSSFSSTKLSPFWIDLSSSLYSLFLSTLSFSMISLSCSKSISSRLTYLSSTLL